MNSSGSRLDQANCFDPSDNLTLHKLDHAPNHFLSHGTLTD